MQGPRWRLGFLLIITTASAPVTRASAVGPRGPRLGNKSPGVMPPPTAPSFGSPGVSSPPVADRVPFPLLKEDIFTSSSRAFCTPPAARLAFAGSSPRALTELSDGAEIADVEIRATSEKNLLKRGKPVTVEVRAADGERYQGPMSFFGKLLSSQNEITRDPDERARALEIVKMHPEIQAARQFRSADEHKSLTRTLLAHRFTRYPSDRYLFRDLQTGDVHFIDVNAIRKIKISGVDATEKIKAALTRIAVECRQQKGPDCSDHALLASALQQKLDRGVASRFALAVHARSAFDPRNQKFLQQAHDMNYDINPFVIRAFQHEAAEILYRLIQYHAGQGAPPRYLNVQEYSQLRGLRKKFGLEGYVTDDLQEALRALDRGQAVKISMPVEVTHAGTTRGGPPPPDAPKYFNYERGEKGPTVVRRVEDDGFYPLRDATPEEGYAGKFRRHAVAALALWPAGAARAGQAARQRQLVIGDSNDPVDLAKHGELDRHLPRVLDADLLANPPFPTDLPPPPWSVEEIEQIFNRIISGRTHFLILGPRPSP
jgi:hypothetical protein